MGMELRKLRDMPFQLEKLRSEASSSEADRLVRLATMLDMCLPHWFPRAPPVRPYMELITGPGRRSVWALRDTAPATARETMAARPTTAE
jgi:hypothetical protein